MQRQIKYRKYVPKIIFFGIVFVSSSYDHASASPSVILSHAITKSSMILAEYLLYLGLHVVGFQI